MGGWISYNGENIAHYSPIVGRKNPSQPNEQVTRYNFSFKSLEDLITLLNAALRDIIEPDNNESGFYKEGDRYVSRKPRHIKKLKGKVDK